MYAKIKDNQLAQYPYGYAELQADNPHTNFNGADVYAAFQGTEANLAGATLQGVVPQQRPSFDERTQKAALSDMPVLENGQWVLKWVVADKNQEELIAQDQAQALSVRSERNAKLSASDWTQVADAPVDQAAWATYRQALRDITAQEGFPWTIDWPVQP